MLHEAPPTEGGPAHRGRPCPGKKGRQAHTSSGAPFTHRHARGKKERGGYERKTGKFIDVNRFQLVGGEGERERER